MTTVPDDQLYKNAARARGRVVVITGGANGIGKETAFTFARHGCVRRTAGLWSSILTTLGRAKVVIGDLDVSNGEAVVAEIQKTGG